MIADPIRKPRVVYPTGDGKPVAETELHFREILAIVQVLDRLFAARPDVYVAANNFVYFEKGNPSACFSPDVYVVLGVQKKLRDTYMTWKEGGRVPSFVLEMTSASTKDEDLGAKKKKCERLGVREYFMFDPYCEYLSPQIQGFRLEHGQYVQIPPDDHGRVFSDVLNYALGANDELRITVYDPRTGEALPRMDELFRREAERAEREAERAQHQAERAQRAENEIERLKAEVERLKNRN